jgi:hypothetical protein
VLQAQLQFEPDSQSQTVLVSSVASNATSNNENSTAAASSVTINRNLATLPDFFNISYAAFLENDAEKSYLIDQIAFLLKSKCYFDDVSSLKGKYFSLFRSHQRAHNDLGQTKDLRLRNLHSHLSELLWNHNDGYVHHLCKRRKS